MAAFHWRSWWRRFSSALTADHAWLALFLPALLSFFTSLHGYLNRKEVAGIVHRLSEEMNTLVPAGAMVELVTEGLKWAEGPCWVQDDEVGRGFLVFSDTIANNVFKWEEGTGLFTIGKSLYLSRSGCRSDPVRCDRLIEPGSNGLFHQYEKGGAGALLACEHGERRVSRIYPNGTARALATHFGGRRLNSPNDLAVREGVIYFTDPPYGLNGKEDDPERELPFNGVYRIVGPLKGGGDDPAGTCATEGKALPEQGGAVAAAHGVAEAGPGGAADGAGEELRSDGVLELIDSSMTRPNGLAFSPDGSALYVANSDAADPHWRIFAIDASGAAVSSRRFVDARDLWRPQPDNTAAAVPAGNPDGLKVDAGGRLWATGPGGVVVLSPEGRHLGTLTTGGRKAANVAFGGDGFLYIAATDAVLRVRVSVGPAAEVAVAKAAKAAGG